MSNVTIVPMAPDHIGSFHHALDVVARERKYLTFLEAPPLEQTRDFVMSLIASGDAQCIGLDRGEVVGWCDVRRHVFPAHAHRGTLGMGIIPSHRGQGLGRRLIEATLASARLMGLVRIELSVRADNAAALSLYNKVGFIREGLVRDAVFVDGEYRDAIAMAIVERSNEPSRRL